MADPTTTTPAPNATGGSTPAPEVDLYGDGLLFGLGVIAQIPGMAITELKYDEEVQFTAQAEGQDSAIAAMAISKKFKFSGTGSGYLLDMTAFRGCKSFVHEGNTLFITKRGKALNFKEFQKCDFSFMGAEGITATAGS